MFPKKRYNGKRKEKPSRGPKKFEKRGSGDDRKASYSKPRKSFKKDDDKENSSIPGEDNFKRKPSRYGEESRGTRKPAYDKPRKFYKKKNAYVPTPHNDGLTRLNKYIANTGVCSRREADDLIKSGV